MNSVNGRIIRSFEEWKALTKEEKDFYLFEQLSKIDRFQYKLKNLDKIYASKLTERLVYGGVSITLTVLLIALVSLVVMRNG